MRPASPKKKRILYGTTVGLSARAFLRGQLAWLRERGWEVTLATTPDEHAEHTVERENVSFIGIPMQRRISPLADVQALLKWIRTLRKVRPHVVTLGTPKASLLGGFAAWVLRIPKRIYIVHGLRLEGSSGLLSWLLWVAEWATIKMSTDVVAISPSLGEELVRRRLGRKEEIWLIGQGSSNGVNADDIHHRTMAVDNLEVREQLGIGPDKFVVGYIGRITRAKGVDTLVDTLRNASLRENIVLLIIGSFEDSKLKADIEANGSRIYVIPWTDDVWAYLPAIDLLCLPTLREGFGNVVIEAAAAGIPAVTTRVTGAIDTLVDGVTGYFVEVGDAQALVDRFNLLEGDPELLSRLGANAKERAERFFQPETIWSGLEAIAVNKTELPQVRKLHQHLESSDTK